jgi:hypothetical protein
MGAIEPYPRGAIGGNLGLAYNMNFKKWELFIKVA